MHNFDIKNPKDKSYFEKKCNFYICMALFGILLFAIIIKINASVVIDNKLIEFGLIIGLGISLMSFMAGILLHPTYDLVDQDNNWRIEDLKDKSPEIKNYILKVGKQGRTLYNIELSMLYSFHERKTLKEQENKIYNSN
jgi:hypothetical protein